jgi:ppGpp synthetase/RelA/SpoT-type nucleotidyltranferase
MQKTTRQNRTNLPAARGAEKIDLADKSAFCSHPWVEQILSRYRRDALLAEHAMQRISDDVRSINYLPATKSGRVRFTTVEGRVKLEVSVLRKLYQKCKAGSRETGVTPTTLQSYYDDIKDICGVRLACPYYDEVLPAIASIRSRLEALGYVTNVTGLADRNFLDSGDELGYRSYHFFVKVPTETTIFGDSELCLCEVQVRTELQHIWAVKSHDLLYKKDLGWQETNHVAEDMRQLSNSLRAADQSLISIRDRSRIRSRK